MGGGGLWSWVFKVASTWLKGKWVDEGFWGQATTNQTLMSSGCWSILTVGIEEVSSGLPTVGA